MQLTLLKSKIHRATVTGASLHYEGNFGSYSAEEAARHQPRILVLDEKNRVVRQEGIEPSLKVVGE